MKKMLLAVLFFVLISLLLTSCGFDRGDEVYARRDVKLRDYTVIAFVKPVTCTLVKGQEVIVTDEVVYPMGGADSISMLWVYDPNTECLGAAPSEFFRK